MANRTDPARKKYRALYGFPSGTGGMLHSLHDFLVYVATKAPTAEELPMWFIVNGTSKPARRTALNYAQMPQQLGLYKRDRDHYALTREGQEWLDTQNHTLLLSLLTREFDFIGEILSALDESPRSTGELFALSSAQGHRWRGTTQVSIRLSCCTLWALCRKTAASGPQRRPYIVHYRSITQSPAPPPSGGGRLS